MRYLRYYRGLRHLSNLIQEVEGFLYDNNESVSNDAFRFSLIDASRHHPALAGRVSCSYVIDDDNNGATLQITLDGVPVYEAGSRHYSSVYGLGDHSGYYYGCSRI